MINLKEKLSEGALKYYISEEEIQKMHPLEVDSHEIYEAAMWMVSERNDKYELVDLVHALLYMLESRK